jgi:hypothetical protein
MAPGFQIDAVRDTPGSMTCGPNPKARLAMIFVVALLTYLFASSAALSAAANSMCVAKGPKWVIYPAHGGAPIKGNTYNITTMAMGDTRPTCAWAKAALARIFRANPPPLRSQQALRGAPRGFSCTGGSGGVIVAPKLAAGGHCIKRSGDYSGQLFTWTAIDPKLVR